MLLMSSSFILIYSAMAIEYREVVCTSPIPAAPQANRRIKQAVLHDTFVSNATAGKTYHVPGYTGFVPGIRATYVFVHHIVTC
jgi:hypothetical protein